MQELSLVGLHDDGEHVVLAGPEGQRFRVRVDEALRVAVRRDRPRLGQIQLQADGSLRPREIQARIRAGQTAQEVAEAAGVPVEHVRRYEGPVLAEREFVVRQARSVRLRRHGAPAGPGVPTLEEQVHQRLAAREVDERTADWDAWRSEDGTWVVALAFTAAERRRRARWTYDVQLRSVTALDDEARWLSDDEPPQVIEARRAGVLGSGPPDRRPRATAPVVDDRGADGGDRGTDGGTDGDDRPDGVYDVDADGGVRTDGEADLPPGAAATVDLLDTLRERRGRRQRITLPDDEGPHRAEGSAARTGGGAESAHPSRSRNGTPRDGVLVLPDADPLPVSGSPVPGPSYAGHPSAGRASRSAARRPAGAGSAPGPAGSPDPPPTPARGALAHSGGPATNSATGPATGSGPGGDRDPSHDSKPRDRQQRRSQPAAPTTPQAAGRATGPVTRPATAVPAVATTPVLPGTGSDTGVDPGSVDTDGDRVPSRRAARRASVPSWDDIVFGSRRE